ncbi:hypothetical protein [Pseudarthrobacter sp. PvP090]|uniref:hypothetical protein n=1 Tax=Pseudarthrobacter sp. PvP090 TaxID=3156393 RepID=UPI0033917E39
MARGEAYWRFIDNVLTLYTPVGRKVARRAATSEPPIRIFAKDLARAGVARVPRLTGTVGGQPQLDGRRFGGTFDGGSSAVVRTVIWATGYRPDIDRIGGVDRDAEYVVRQHRTARAGPLSSCAGASAWGS